MVLIRKQHILHQLGLISLMLLFSACSTVSTVNQPSVQDKSTPAVTTAKAKPAPAPASTTTAPEPKINDAVEPITEQGNSVPVAPKTTSPVQQNSAVIALIGTAQQQQKSGDLYSAQTSLQRAQRIAPRDPYVYYELASIHRELHDYDLAEQVALKGISIVQGQPQQLHRFWTLIAQIRADSGDRKGASQAQQIADRY